MSEPLKIKKVITLCSCDDVNSYLKGGWRIVETASGVDEDGYPVILTMVGLPDEIPDKW